MGPSYELHFIPQSIFCTTVRVEDFFVESMVILKVNNISGYLPGRIVFFLVCVLLCNQGPQSEVETACKILSFFFFNDDH